MAEAGALAPATERDVFRVEGEEVHEVAVGPVHAGVIEPGHFRFQCHGEQVLHLEISLGYQHRGVGARCCRAVPTPGRCTWPRRSPATPPWATPWPTARRWRRSAAAPCRHGPTRSAAIALELERIANHVGDLGALAGDVAFLPTASFCGRIRGDVLNLTAAICGSRFGRGLVRAGRARFDVDDRLADSLRERLARGRPRRPRRRRADVDNASP